MNNLARAAARWLVRWATFVRAVRDCSLHHIAQTRTPVSDWRTAVLWHWWRARKPKSRQTSKCTWNTGRRERIATFRCQTMFRKSDVDLESIQPMRNPVPFRQLSPYPHKSVVIAQVFGSVTSWRDRGPTSHVAAACRCNNPRFPSYVQLLGEETTSVKTTNVKTVRISWRSQQSACNAAVLYVASQIDTIRPLERQASSIFAN